MSEKDFTTEPTPIEEKISSEKLANDYLSFRDSQIKENLQKVKESDDWTRNYSPKSPGPRPSYVEPGSMDASDWDLAQGEYDQLEEQREGDLNDNEIRKQELYSEMDEIGILREQVLYGDKRIIDELANKERERLADIEDKKRKEEMRQAIFEKKKEGVVLEGVHYLLNQLNNLDEKNRLGEIPNNKTGPNGWVLERYWNDINRHVYSKDKGLFEVDISTKPVGGSVKVRIDSFSNPLQEYEDGKSRSMDTGSRVEFSLKGDRVHNWYNGFIERTYNWGYPETESKQNPEEDNFDQTDLNLAGGVLEELISDMNSISVEKNA